MIILSNSIPKTGSTLLANFQEDILSSLGRTNGQNTLRDKYNGRYIEYPSWAVLLNLASINRRYGSCVVKCHWAPSAKLDLFCQSLNVKMTLTYRDPRDMILSMIDHGKRTREGNDPSGSFADCTNVIDLIPRTLKMVENLDLWTRKRFVRSVRYESLMADTHNTLKEVVSFLGWKVEDSIIEDIINERDKIKHRSLNFNKGTTQRWKTELDDSEKEVCKLAFNQHLIKLGYELE